MHAHAYYLTYMSRREQIAIFNLKSFSGGQNERPFCPFVYLEGGSASRAWRETLAVLGNPSLTSVEGKCFEAYVNKAYI